MYNMNFFIGQVPSSKWIRKGTTNDRQDKKRSKDQSLPQVPALSVFTFTFSAN